MGVFNAVRSKGWPWLAVWVLPALLLAALMVRYGENLPTYDQWDTPGGVFVKLAEHQPLTFADFISLYFPTLYYFPIISQHFISQHNESYFPTQ
jgi:hypothetical protein